MRAVFVFGFLFSLLNNTFSHSPNEVSFSIYKKDTFILVDTEFPWAIRNAVFMADSLLNDSSTKEEINNSLFTYVKHNFVLKDIGGEPIKLLKLVDTKNEGHHENYQFVFEKKEIGEIKNTLLFNFSKKQKNFHVLNLEGEKIQFVLTPDSPEKVIKKKQFPIKYLFVVFLGIIFLIAFLFRKRLNAST